MEAHPPASVVCLKLAWTLTGLMISPQGDCYSVSPPLPRAQGPQEASHGAKERRDPHLKLAVRDIGHPLVIYYFQVISGP